MYTKIWNDLTFITLPTFTLNFHRLKLITLHEITSYNLKLYFQRREGEKKTGEGRKRKGENVEGRRKVEEEGAEGEGGERKEGCEGEGGEREEGGV